MPENHVDDLKWEEPPAFNRGRPRRGALAAVAARLKERPGEWALIREDVATSLVTYLRNGPMGDGFEVSARRMPEQVRGRGNIYARYVGTSR